MPAHFDKYLSKHSAKDLFNIVADVEKYPEFLPWVAASRITAKNEDYFIADLLVKFKSFSHKYTSKVELFSATEKNPFYKIDVNLVKGPFKHLVTNWIFEEKENMTEISFNLDFKFESILLEKMIGFLFEKAVKKMTEAFIKRADELLEKKS
jgi:coenzyme Q-binding protein COQ10